MTRLRRVFLHRCPVLRLLSCWFFRPALTWKDTVWNDRGSVCSPLLWLGIAPKGLPRSVSPYQSSGPERPITLSAPLSILSVPSGVMVPATLWPWTVSRSDLLMIKSQPHSHLWLVNIPLTCITQSEAEKTCFSGNDLSMPIFNLRCVFNMPTHK